MPAVIDLTFQIGNAQNQLRPSDRYAKRIYRGTPLWTLKR